MATLFQWKEVFFMVEPDAPQAWTPRLFEHFLKLMLISQGKVNKIDCQFEEVNIDSLREILRSASDELAKMDFETRASVLIVRKISRKITIFLIEIEKEPRRFTLNCFSSALENDENSNLKCRSWKQSLPEVKCKPNCAVTKAIFDALLINDILQTPYPTYKMTRVGLYSVISSVQYPETARLYKLLHHLGLEPSEKAIEKLNEQYLIRAQEFLVKDASVAKAQQGFSYQEHLIMLLAYIAMKNKLDDFTLAAEAMVPEAWNDVFMRCNGEVIFFQQKHRSLYSTSVKEAYSVKDVLDKDGKEDCSILKYFKSYCLLKKQIQNKKHPLNWLEKELAEDKLKFIFFTNRTFPMTALLELKDRKDKKDIKLESVESEQIPLGYLPEFKDMIVKGNVFKFQEFPAKELGLADVEQAELNEFLGKFYLFQKQKSAEKLFEQCKTIIKTPLGGGFGEGVLADTFAHYVHRWFVAENPENHTFNHVVIKNFFDNHEQYYYNLVNYSSFEQSDDQVKRISDKHLKQLTSLNCMKAIKSSLSNGKSVIDISCQDPFLALHIIQSLFKPGERQVFTPFTRGLGEYKASSNVKYAILIGTEDELCGISEKLNKQPNIRIIRINSVSKNIPNSIPLGVMPKELAFLKEDCFRLSFLGAEDKFCLTDLLNFALSNLPGGLSEEENATYVPQRLSNEEVILPFEQLEEAMKRWVEEHADEVANSWVCEIIPTLRIIFKIKIKLPKYLGGKKIQDPSSLSFKWDQEKGELYYIIKTIEIKDLSIKEYKCKSFDEDTEMDFECSGKERKERAEKEGAFDGQGNQTAAACKIIAFKFEKKFDGEVPPHNWKKSKDGKVLYFWPYAMSKLCAVDWESCYPDKSVSIVEAEAACGKTWHLKSRIDRDKMRETKRIPIFIRVKEFSHVKDSQNQISELISQCNIPSYLRRMVVERPQYFELLFDGFDELSKEYQDIFKSVLEQALQIGYSITITVRDYQLNNLINQTSCISIKQRLNKFNEPEIKKCFEKSLGSFIINLGLNLEFEVAKLCGWLKEQASINEWLGIPFHVALISEWYREKYNGLVGAAPPKIAEIYNFIIQTRINRCSKRNRGDLYKLLYRIAWKQIFGGLDLNFSIVMKEHKFKTSFSFDLERSGLLRDPHSENPELVHRTFAEFLVAKRLMRKVASDSCQDSVFNLNLIKLLYQEQYRLVSLFFNELYLMTDNDPDMPYQLSAEHKQTFESRWLQDVFGQNLCEVSKQKFITWKNEEAEVSDDVLRKGSTSLSKTEEAKKTVQNITGELKQVPSPFAELKKDIHRACINKAFAAYDVVKQNNVTEAENFHKIIRDVNIRLFLREDFPEGTSFYSKLKNIDEFDIKSVQQGFENLEKVSKEYSWHRNVGSYAFKCWSQGGYKDVDFAIPILRAIGPHLNIVHVFYIRLYASYGGCFDDDNKKMVDIAINHNVSVTSELHPKVIFSSLLLFLGLVEDWRSTQENPKLPRAYINKIFQFFEVLMNEDITDEARLFIKILFVDCVTYFNIRVHLDYEDTQKPDFFPLILIFSDGTINKPNINFNYDDRQALKEIFSEYVGRQNLSGVERFSHFFAVWEQLMNKPTRTRKFLLPNSGLASDSDSGLDSDSETITTDSEENDSKESMPRKKGRLLVFSKGAQGKPPKDQQPQPKTKVVKQASRDKF